MGKWGPTLHYRGMPRLRAASKSTPRRPPQPPRGAPSATGGYAHLYSGDILYDPGLELYYGNQIGDRMKDAIIAKIGVEVFVLPRYADTCATGSVWPNGTCVDRLDIPQWVQFSEPYVVTGTKTDSAWHVCDFGPSSGTFHLVWWNFTQSASYGGSGFPGNLVAQAPGLPGGYSARVNAGDLVTFSLNRSRFGGSVGTIQSYLSLYFYRSTGAGIRFVTSSASTITTTYADQTLSSYAPKDTYFVRALVTWAATGVSGPQNSLSVDTGTLSVERG